MNPNRIVISFAVFLTPFISCREHLKPVATKRVILIQPFNDFSPVLAANVFTALKAINPNTNLKTAIQLPVQSYYAVRNRYGAGSIIRYRGKFGSIDTFVIGLTGRDAKGKNDDWGVMGLGY